MMLHDSPARKLLARMAIRAGLDENLAPDADLSQAGMSSSDMIRLALSIEDVVGAALEPEELEELSSLSAIDALIARKSRQAVAG